MQRISVTCLWLTLGMLGQINNAWSNEVFLAFEQPGSIYEIVDLTIDSDGNYIVLGRTGGGSSYSLTLLEPEGNLVRQIVGNREILGAESVAVNSTGSIFVARRSTSEPLRIYDYNGVAQPPFEFLPPSSIVARDVAVDGNDNVYFLNRGVVHAFDSAGVLQHSINGGLQFASHLAVAPNGDIYIADHYEIQAYKPSGEFIREISVRGLFPETHPLNQTGVWDLVVQDSAIFVASNLSVLKLDLEGNLDYASIGHSGASGIELGVEHDLLITETPSCCSNESFVRSVNESTLREWDGSTFTNQEHGPFRLFNQAVDNGRIPEYSNAIETSAETFRVPGEPGELVELTFTHEASLSGVPGAFGLYHPREIEADRSDPVALGLEIIEEGDILIREHSQSTCDAPTSCSATVVFEAGTELGFYIIGDLVLQTPARVSTGRLGPSDVRYPTFSDPDLNLAGFDQMLAFIGEGQTLFAFEDLKIGTGRADFLGDFTDMVISVDAILIPVVPEPSTLCMSLMLIGLCLSRAESCRNR